VRSEECGVERGERREQLIVQNAKCKVKDKVKGNG
jgi:hypothetical protein